jgi:hypothetical protein
MRMHKAVRRYHCTAVACAEEHISVLVAKYFAMLQNIGAGPRGGHIKAKQAPVSSIGAETHSGGVMGLLHPSAM